MKWGIWCSRSNVSVFGNAESWMKDDGHVVKFDSKEEAETYIGDYIRPRSVTWTVREYNGSV